jgi:hypothetical protein
VTRRGSGAKTLVAIQPPIRRSATRWYAFRYGPHWRSQRQPRHWPSALAVTDGQSFVRDITDKPNRPRYIRAASSIR